MFLFEYTSNTFTLSDLHYGSRFVFSTVAGWEDDDCFRQKTRNEYFEEDVEEEYVFEILLSLQKYMRSEFYE